MRNRQHVIIIVILTALNSILFLSCGLKAPPIPPRTEIPKPVTDLTKKIDENHLILSWSIPEFNKKNRFKGFIVYRAKTSQSSSKCPDCPKMFEKAGVISVEDPKPGTTDKKILFQETLTKGYTYTYMVKGISEKSAESPDSNIVTFDF